MKAKRPDDLLFNLSVALILAVGILAITAASCVYARWSYGDWHCGLPGVQCRKEMP